MLNCVMLPICVGITLQLVCIIKFICTTNGHNGWKKNIHQHFLQNIFYFEDEGSQPDNTVGQSCEIIIYSLMS